MYAASELSHLVRTRRTDMGISQTDLSRLSGLSRATVNQVEKGTIKDLSLTRIAQLLEVLGLSLNFTPARERVRPLAPKMSALERAAKSASISYSREMPARALQKAIETGIVLSDYEPHVNAVLEDASVALLANVVEQVHASSGMPHDVLWSGLALATAASIARVFMMPP